MYQRQGAAAFKKDLTNTHALLEELDRPERKFKSIHVGGTNGKGTVSHLLASALMTAGYKVGLYTSPHYRDFRERIKIDGQLVDEDFVVDFVERIRPAIERIQPSFFEITVAMAFDAFARAGVDYAVVEVGLGGRLDSTNVIDPVLSVITNVSLDHTDMLGDTVELIAAEKSKIIKPGRPVVIGEYDERTFPVFKAEAAAQGSPLLLAKDEFRAVPIGRTADGATVFELARTFADQVMTHAQLIGTRLSGPFLNLNLRTAYAALHQLPEVRDISYQSAWSNLDAVNYLGRWQFIGESPRVLVDSAHNPGGLQPVLEQLVKLTDAPEQLHIVLGVVNDKDLNAALPLFPVGARYYFCKADIPRGLPAEELQRAAAGFGLKGACYESVAEALEAAKSAADPEKGLVFVGGSIFTVAEVV